MSKHTTGPQTTRLLEAIRLAQTEFILESSTAAAFRLLLDELLALTGSEYGYIGEIESIDNKTALRVRAYTDISWNDETRQLLRDNAETGLVFDNMDTLFGYGILHDAVVIANDAPNDARAGGIPEGHPPLNTFLGIPFHFGDQLIGQIGLANRPEGYSQEYVEFLSPLISTCGIMVHSRRLSEDRERHKHLQEEAERTQRLVEFSKKLAHDLNNLLTVTMTTIDAHQITDSESMGAEDVDRIELATRRAAELTRKILTFAGNTAVNRSSTHLSTVATEAAMICNPIFPPDLHLKINVPEELPHVSADVSILQQAITNMVFNSVEAIGDNKGTIELRAHQQDDKHVIFEVIDDGPGMDDATRQRAFDPYFTTKEGYRGFGLASVLGFAKSHQVTLNVDTEVGKGTVIRLNLPITGSSTQFVDSVESFEFIGKTVLLVDDNHVVRQSLSKLLEAAQATVIEAASGEKALEILQQHRQPDLLITDIKMPGINGFELTHQLRTQGMVFPAILISGQTDQTIPAELEQDPCCMFVKKPFSLAELQKACATVSSVAQDH